MRRFDLHLAALWPAIIAVLSASLSCASLSMASTPTLVAPGLSLSGATLPGITPALRAVAHIWSYNARSAHAGCYARLSSCGSSLPRRESRIPSTRAVPPGLPRPTSPQIEMCVSTFATVSTTDRRLCLRSQNGDLYKRVAKCANGRRKPTYAAQIAAIPMPPQGKPRCQRWNFPLPIYPHCIMNAGRACLRVDATARRVAHLQQIKPRC